MCEYCNEDFDGYYRPLDKNAHVGVFDKPHEKILDINWYGHKMKINIDYCPMCGRDLRRNKTMLSDEEKQAMESLIEIREFANLSNYKDTKISQLNALDIVLNLIEKQSKEIEELQVKNKKLRDKCKELIFEKQELTSALLDSTPNDKIKAKIEEVEQWELYNMKIPKLSTLDERLGAKIGIKYVLQSLLGKE